MAVICCGAVCHDAIEAHLQNSRNVPLLLKLAKALVALLCQIDRKAAIAALGMKTSLLALARIGIAPVMLLITQTVFIGLLVVGLIYGLRVFGI